MSPTCRPTAEWPRVRTRSRGRGRSWRNESRCGKVSDRRVLCRNDLTKRQWKECPAMSDSLTIGEYVFRLLRRYGVDTVFGIPGVHTLELYRGIANENMRHV